MSPSSRSHSILERLYTRRVRHVTRQTLGPVTGFTLGGEAPPEVRGPVLGAYRPAPEAPVQLWFTELGLWRRQGEGWGLIAFSALTAVHAPRVKDPDDPRSQVVTLHVRGEDPVVLRITGRQGRTLHAFSVAQFLLTVAGWFPLS